MAWNKLVPDAYDYSKAQLGQYVKVCPEWRLPVGKVLVINNIAQGDTYPKMRARGMTHYERGSETYLVGPRGYDAAYHGEAFADTERINDRFHMTTSTSKAQCEANADAMDISNRLLVFETQENVNFLDPSAVQWKWFYERLIARFEAQKAVDGKPYFVCHNYFHFAGGIFGLGIQTREQHRLLYTTPVDQWPTITYTDANSGSPRTAVNEYTPGNTLAATNMVLSGVYFDSADVTPELMMATCFDMDTLRMQGKHSGIFAAARREYRPNWWEFSHYSDGDFARADKIVSPPVLFGAISFWGLELGDVALEWSLDTFRFQPDTKKPISYYAEFASSDHWYPGGYPGAEGENPYRGNTSPGNFGLGGNADFMGFGAKMWNDTMGQVPSPAKGFLKYRLDDSPAWIDPSVAGSDLVDARFDKRGFMKYRLGGGKLAVAYQNFYANGTKHKIEWKHPTTSQTWVDYVSGTGCHAKLITL